MTNFKLFKVLLVGPGAELEPGVEQDYSKCIIYPACSLQAQISHKRQCSSRTAIDSTFFACFLDSVGCPGEQSIKQLGSWFSRSMHAKKTREAVQNVVERMFHSSINESMRGMSGMSEKIHD